jgi:hypothetical protein
MDCKEESMKYIVLAMVAFSAVTLALAATSREAMASCSTPNGFCLTEINSADAGAGIFATRVFLRGASAKGGLQDVKRLT